MKCCALNEVMGSLSKFEFGLKRQTFVLSGQMGSTITICFPFQSRYKYYLSSQHKQ